MRKRNPPAMQKSSYNLLDEPLLNAAYSPVHCVEHFYHHKHGKSHSHGLRMPEDSAIDSFESTLLGQALRLMRLNCLRARREKQRKEHAVLVIIPRASFYLFMALSISTTTRTDNAMVMGLGFSKIRQSMPWKLSCSAKHCM